jgi:hypothetical protein
VKTHRRGHQRHIPFIFTDYFHQLFSRRLTRRRHDGDGDGDGDDGDGDAPRSPLVSPRDSALDATHFL